MAEYTLKEFRPGRFVKIVDGEVVSLATAGEIATYLRLARRARVDPGIIEVSLAVSALLAVVFTQSWPVLLRVISGVAFAMSSWAALYLYSSYVVQRIPITWTRFYKSRLRRILQQYEVPSAFWVWLLWDYPTLIARMMTDPRADFDTTITEFGYLTLMAAMVLGVLVVFAYVAFEVFLA